MADLKVDTGLVLTCAVKLENANNKIRDGFPSVERAINRLDNTWEGAAATNAISKFNEMRSQMPEARYTVLSNYINFLRNQVGEGYEQTEAANTSLADAFK